MSATTGEHDMGVFNSTGWEPPAEPMPESDWLAAMNKAAEAYHLSMWQIGDLWAYGDRTYGIRKAVTESPGWKGPSFQTCVNAANVARRFTTNRRRLIASFTHHAEVAMLPEKEADELLDWAEREKKSSRELRERVQQWRKNPNVFDKERAATRVAAYLQQSGPLAEQTKWRLQRTLKTAPDLAIKVADGELTVHRAYALSIERSKESTKALHDSRPVMTLAERGAPGQLRAVNVVPLHRTADEERQHIFETAQRLMKLGANLREVTDANVSAMSLLKRMTRDEANQLEAHLRTGVRFLHNVIDTWSFLKKEIHDEQPTSTSGS